MANGARSVTERVRAVLMGYVSSISAESVLKGALRRTGRAMADLDRNGLDEATMLELDRGLGFFLGVDADRSEALGKLRALSREARPESAAQSIEIAIREEDCVVDARTQARAFARELGFDRTDQAKIATSVSELARNAYAYASGGRVELSPLQTPRSGMKIVSTDDGPGIANLDEILAGKYRSRTGMGLGILACKRLMDEFAIDTLRGRGTVITLKKYLP